MKDLQLDATALPGKAFDLSFEMPERRFSMRTEDDPEYVPVELGPRPTA